MLSSGLNFGYKRTLPHMMGVAFGFAFMVVCVGMGINIIFEAYPFVYDIMKVVGFIYIIWMAWQIANSSVDIKENKNNKPFTFIQIVLFQWINPKAWIMAVTAISSFTLPNQDMFTQVLVIAFIYLLSGFISTNTWTLGGVFLKKLLKNKKAVKIFNISMALLLVASIVPVIFE
jgi:threonine/homoserine/homoserine lactone efflux protein